MDLTDLLGVVVKQSLGVRGKPTDAVTSWLIKGVKRRPGLAVGAALGAAGLAYGMWERSQRAASPPPLTPDPTTPLPPWPAPATPSGAQPPPLPVQADDQTQLRRVRLVLAAAQADGAVAAVEMQRVIDAARAAGAEQAILQDLGAPRDVESIVAGASDPEERRGLYALAFAIVRCDQDVADAERQWLARLAGALSLGAADVAAIEADVASGIDGMKTS